MGGGRAADCAGSGPRRGKETRRLLFAVSDLFHPLPADGKGVKMIGQSGIFIGRVMKHADELAALQSAGRLTRQAAFDILYPDIVEKGKRDGAAADTLEDLLVERLDNSQIIRATKILADTGATFAEVLDSMEHNRPLPRAPYMASVGGSLDGYGMKGEAGIKSMRDDIYRPSMPTVSATGKWPEGVRLRYVFRFADETLECGGTSEAKAKPVMDRISAKLRELCTAAHPAQLDSVALALGQGQLGQLSCLSEFGLDANEHIPVEYTIAKDAATGAVSVFIKEPENFPVKFNWTVTVGVDGTVTSTSMRIDHGQYEAEAMTHAGTIAAKVPGNDRAAAEAVIRDALAHCGNDFDLKGLVAKYIDKLGINGAGELRTPEQIKAKIDALRANLAEIRATSNGNPAAEKAGIVFLDTLGAQSVPPGMIGRIVQASLYAKPGEYAKVPPRLHAPAALPGRRRHVQGRREGSARRPLHRRILRRTGGGRRARLRRLARILPLPRRQAQRRRRRLPRRNRPEAPHPSQQDRGRRLPPEDRAAHLGSEGLHREAMLVPQPPLRRIQPGRGNRPRRRRRRIPRL